jgi:purine-binding chemotaxis protein CheW
MSRRQVVSGDELQFIVFRVGQGEYALRIDQVERILRYVPPERWEQGPEFLAGRIAYGSGLVPLLDLRARAAVKPTLHEETRIMVLVPAQQPLAVAVDQVREAMRVDTRTIQPAAGAESAPLGAAAGGAFERAGRSIMILNAARLLSDAERLALSEALT